MSECEQRRFPFMVARSVSSIFDGGRSIICSPIWYGIVVVLLEILPSTIAGSYMVALQKEQFGDNAYWLHNGSGVVQSLLIAPALGIAGYLSQPERWGRRNVLLFGSCMSVLHAGVAVITLDAYVILGVRTFLTLVGCSAASPLTLTILLSWVTDWSDPRDKATFFSILTGSMFGVNIIGPPLPELLHLNAHSAFVLAAQLKLLSPLFIAVCFPRSTVCAHSAGPVMLEQGLSPSATSVTEGKLSRRLFEAGRYLFQFHMLVFIIYMFCSFTNAASAEETQLYLAKERGFTVADLISNGCCIGVVGFLVQCLGVPALSSCGVRPQILLVFSVLTMALNFAVYSFVSDKILTLILTAVLQPLGFVAPISCLAIISGMSADDNAPREQGLIQGIVSGSSILASCVGPLILAALTTEFAILPAPFNWPGIGFAVLSALMLVGLAMAIRLCCVKHAAPQASTAC